MSGTPGEFRAASLYLNYQLAILLQVWIGCEQVQVLAYGLSDEQAIEGVGVIEGKG